MKAVTRGKSALLAMAIAAGVASVSAVDAQEGANAGAAQKADTVGAKAESGRTQEATDLEIVEVTGIRNNVQQSLAIKQEAVGVVDVVLSEDIGKFPDDNLAEALSRIPGVTMTRDSSEGRNILVRGLGERYNITTINGRRMASEDTGRDFNFDTISSELVRGIAVHKSAAANQPDGGFGAVIDVQTRRPLSLDADTLLVTGDMSYDTRTTDYQPSGSFLYSSHTQDNTFGALLSVVYSKRTVRVDTYTGSGFYNADEQYGSTDVVLPWDVNGDGVVSFNDDAGVSEGTPGNAPAYMYFTNEQDERTRTGASLALQWAPSDKLDLNFDGIYSRYTTKGQSSQIGFVTYDESWTPGVPDIRNVQLDERGYASKYTMTSRPMVEMLSLSEPRKVDTYQAGLNAVWEASSSLQLTTDISRSEAKNSNDGDNDFIVVRGFVDSIDIDYSKGGYIPDVTLNPSLNAAQDYGGHYTRRTGIDIDSKVDSIKLEGLWEIDKGPLASLNFGAHYDNQTKQRREVGTPNASMFSRGGFYLARDRYGYDPSLAFTVGDFTLFRVPGSVFRPASFSNFLDGEDSKVPAAWPSFNSNALLDYYRSINPQAFAAGIQPRLLQASSYDLGEKLTALFVQAKFEGDIFAKRYLLDLGIRYTKTDVSSFGYSYDFSKLVLDSNGLPANNNWRTVVPFGYDDSYDGLLPSMNFRLRLADDMQMRLSAAKVIARPSLDSLRPWAAPNFTTRGLNGHVTLAAGNPGVEPEEAKQVDLTYEWYYAEGSALSVGLFYKKIESFITLREESEEFFGYTFDVTKPRMDKYGATIEGVELSWQQSFNDWLPSPFDGLGLSLTYTYVDSGYADPSYAGAGFVGMSPHSYNASVYYEKGPIQARLAYNWRDEFFSYENWGGNDFINPYGQLDASFSYSISDRFSVTFDAVNILNERYSGYTRIPSQVDYVERFGTQVGIGFRAEF